MDEKRMRCVRSMLSEMELDTDSFNRLAEKAIQIAWSHRSNEIDELSSIMNVTAMSGSQAVNHTQFRSSVEVLHHSSGARSYRLQDRAVDLTLYHHLHTLNIFLGPQHRQPFSPHPYSSNEYNVYHAKSLQRLHCPQIRI